MSNVRTLLTDQPAAAATAVGLSDADRRAILQSMARSIEPVRATPLYSAGLVLVAIAMLVLPLIYLALIALVAYATWWHATGNSMASSGRDVSRWSMFLYLTPLLVGILFIIFLVKPLFARRSRAGDTLSLDPRAQPLLFGFVERLCAIVGAPMPVRIDIDCQVNASASFKSHGPFGWMSRSLVLTIGLPLAAGLNVRELAGVLAHEFGHFAQGTGMRVSFIIRSVNAWLYRVVNGRDTWDEAIGEIGGAFGLVGAVVVLISSVLIWLTRRILWCLMLAGHVISSFMSRQMEFDADQYEARVAGADAFEQTSRKLRLLNVAQSAVLDELQSHWRERRICSDLPTLIARRVGDLPPGLVAALDQQAAQSRTAWHDSHPSDADRVAAVRRSAAAGIVTVEAPASSLFADFDSLCARVTGDFYSGALGAFPEDAEIVTPDEVVGRRQERKASFGALERYFQGLLHAVRPVFVQADAPLPVSHDAAAEQILLARSDLAESLPAARAAQALWEASMAKLTGFTRAWALHEVGQKRIDPAIGLTPAELARLSDVYHEQTASAQAARQVLDPLLARQLYRLQCALEIDRLSRPVPPPPPPVADEDDYGAYDVQQEPAPVFGDTVLLVAALDAIRQVATPVDDLRVQLLRLGQLLGQLKPDHNDQRIIDSILQVSWTARRALEDIRQTLGSAWYPYQHGEQGVTLAKFAVPHLPEATAVGAITEAADTALEGIYGLYVRVMGDLASRAEAIEASLGLSPLPEPAATDPTPADTQATEPCP